MKTFHSERRSHSDDTRENTQNLSDHRQEHIASHLNSVTVGVAYSREASGIKEDHEFFNDLDELFEADCGNYAEYRENLESLEEEYSTEIDEELSALNRENTGDEV